MSLYIVDIHGEIEGDYEIVRKYKEQESILDKVRAEIKQLPITDTAIKLVEAVIDKYKAESEDKE